MDAGVPVAIVGDVTRVRQILVNLLNNAVKFTEHGEVVVTVTRDGGQKTEDGPVVGHPSSVVLQFSVRDTGIGIPPDRWITSFNPLVRWIPRFTRRYGGTGLGLAISKRLAEMMGGTMWVESTAGQGSTFHFTITAEAVAASTEQAQPAGEQPQLRGRRVMIVDDNATSRQILHQQCAGWGMLPRDTTSPEEALMWLRRGDPFDLAVLDQNMPEMDGVTLAAEIYKLPNARELPMILLSSLESRDNGADLGIFVASVSKPIRPSALFDALMSVLAVRAQPVSAATVMPRNKTEADTAPRLPLRILLAEDNAVNQKLALRLLAQLGYQADVVSNGIERYSGAGAAALRRDPDGRADAGDGRAGGHAAHLRPLAAGGASAHHRHDRECDAG